MMNTLICHAICVCALFVTGINGAIIQRPSNAATIVGGQTVFNCSSDATASITWLYTTDCNTANSTPLTDSNCNIIGSHASHYRTEKTSGFVCNLIVFDALLSHGGCYACIDGFGAAGQYQAMLIIVAKTLYMGPNSTDLIPGDDVILSCSIDYRGPSIPLQPPPLPPSFYWTLQSDPRQNITSYQELTTITTALSYTIVTVQPPNVPPCICNLFFNPPINVPTSCAANAPTYGRSGTTPEYIDSDPPQDVTISVTPNPCLHQSTVDLTCSASGYPTPTYKWFNLTSGAVLSESNTVTINRNGSYHCVASNTIGDVRHSASQTVKVSDCAVFITFCVNLGISDPACISLLVIVIFFGLNLVCFTVFILCYGCSENGRKTLNDRFPWLKKMLPCLNGDGCIRFEWIFLFAILSTFTAIVFFPTIIIVANCCGKKNKTNQGLNSGDINLRQAVYVYENAARANAVPETTSYESLQRPTTQATASVYEELRQPDFLTQREC